MAFVESGRRVTVRGLNSRAPPAFLPDSVPGRYGGRCQCCTAATWGAVRVRVDSPQDAQQFQLLNAGSNGGSGRGARAPHRSPWSPGRNGADPAHWPHLRSSRHTNPAPQTNPVRMGTVQRISRQLESQRSRPSCPCFARFSSALLQVCAGHPASNGHRFLPRHPVSCATLRQRYRPLPGNLFQRPLQYVTACVYPVRAARVRGSYHQVVFNSSKLCKFFSHGPPGTPWAL